jgi:hypothetical protein
LPDLRAAGRLGLRRCAGAWSGRHLVLLRAPGKGSAAHQLGRSQHHAHPNTTLNHWEISSWMIRTNSAPTTDGCCSRLSSTHCTKPGAMSASPRAGAISSWASKRNGRDTGPRTLWPVRSSAICPASLCRRLGRRRRSRRPLRTPLPRQLAPDSSCSDAALDSARRPAALALGVGRTATEGGSWALGGPFLRRARSWRPGGAQRWKPRHALGLLAPGR